MYKLVVSDLDGTLLRPDHRLGDYTRGVLARLRASGVDLVLASGRHFADIRVLAASLAASLAAALIPALIPLRARITTWRCSNSSPTAAVWRS